jgi:prevent-host-death family protein
MKTMSVTHFKAHALAVLDDVATSREAVLLTKRGKPLAEVVPYAGPVAKPQPGTLAHMLVREGDIVSPLGAKDWEAAR